MFAGNVKKDSVKFICSWSSRVHSGVLHVLEPEAFFNVVHIARRAETSTGYRRAGAHFLREAWPFCPSGAGVPHRIAGSHRRRFTTSYAAGFCTENSPSRMRPTSEVLAQVNVLPATSR